MFIRRPLIEKNPFAFDPIHDFGYDNLVVSGCSFTYNNSDQDACTWPYYLKELGNFKSVYDCSLPGAGNYHISHALKWALTIENLDPAKTLVVVMWSGNDRDDAICSVESLDLYPMKYFYTNETASAITGGSHSTASGNTRRKLDCVKDIKSHQSRAVENYLYIDSLKSWLDTKKYKSVFLNYLQKDLPSRTCDFDIRKYLPDQCVRTLDKIFVDCENIYEFALKNDLLFDDDFHPTHEGHLQWTKKCLVPCLKSLNIQQFVSPTLQA